MWEIEEFVFWTAFWWVTASMTRYLVKPPPKLDLSKDERSRDNNRLEYQNHFISLSHAIFSIAVCCYSILKYPWQSGRDWYEIEKMAIKSSFCYFIYDTIYGLIYRYNDIWMNLHHMVMFVSYIFSLRS